MRPASPAAVMTALLGAAEHAGELPPQAESASCSRQPGSSPAAGDLVAPELGVVAIDASSPYPWSRDMLCALQATARARLSRYHHADIAQDEAMLESLPAVPR